MIYRLIVILAALAGVLASTSALSKNWKVETIDPSPEVQWNAHVKITLDGNGHPHIVYGEKTIDYAYFDGNVWHRERIASLTNFGQAWPSIAVDSDGRAHIVFNNHDASRLTYATNASGQWVLQPLDDIGFQPEIAVDAQNRPHIIANIYDESADPVLDLDHGPRKGSMKKEKISISF